MKKVIITVLALCIISTASITAFAANETVSDSGKTQTSVSESQKGKRNKTNKFGNLSDEQIKSLNSELKQKKDEIMTKYGIDVTALEKKQEAQREAVKTKISEIKEKYNADGNITDEQRKAMSEEMKKAKDDIKKISDLDCGLTDEQRDKMNTEIKAAREEIFKKYGIDSCIDKSEKSKSGSEKMGKNRNNCSTVTTSQNS